MSIADAIQRLSHQFADRCVSTDAMREQYAQNEAHHAPVRPDAVVFPESTDEVRQIVDICREAACPITPYGAGTSLEGHIVPVRGGISLDMSRMNQVLQVNQEDMDAVVQPGVTRRQLNEDLRATGLFFPVDPGADASIGGMAATRASGTNAVRYGTMRECVMACEVVLADGRVIRTGSRSRKSSAGYDLCKLFVGSEGTLGIMTELTVKLFGQPEAVSSAVAGFETIEGAVNAVIETIQMGMPVARIELLDGLQIRAVNAYSKLEIPERPTLFLEFHGSETSVAEQAARFGEIASEHGGLGFDWATLEEDRNRLWRARHDAYYGVKAMWPGKRGYITDSCVPISKLAEAILETKAEIDASGLIAPMVGHVGDGNFHLAIMIDPSDPAELKAAEQLSHSIAERSIRMGGTVTGEHGVGLGKIKYMEAEHGAAFGVMAEIKRTFDPHNILNPGKMVSLN